MYFCLYISISVLTYIFCTYLSPHLSLSTRCLFSRRYPSLFPTFLFITVIITKLSLDYCQHFFFLCLKIYTHAPFNGHMSIFYVCEKWETSCVEMKCHWKYRAPKKALKIEALIILMYLHMYLFRSNFNSLL